MAAVIKGYVDTGFGQVHYRKTTGERGGLPIVLLHQTASSSVMFETLMGELGDQFDCVAPDTPGFGGTDAPPEPGSIALYARVLADALSALGIERCLLFGHHTGVSIAVQMLHDRPALAERLALSGPCLLTPEAAADFATKTQGMVLKEDGSHLQVVWERIQGKDAEAPLELKQREAMLTLVAGTRWHEGYHAVFEHAEFGAQLAAVACPTLVFAGDKDTVYHLLRPSFDLLQDD